MIGTAQQGSQSCEILVKILIVIFTSEAIWALMYLYVKNTLISNYSSYLFWCQHTNSLDERICSSHIKILGGGGPW